MNIKFESIKDEKRAIEWSLGGKIRHIGNFLTDPMSMVLTYGRLRYLFGEPLYTTDDLENAYTYLILATDEEGITTSTRRIKTW